MSQYDLTPDTQHWVNLVLIWIGFGTLVGLLASAVLPGKHPVGPLGTLVLGIIGSVLGPLVLTLALPTERFNPIGPVGFLTAVGGAIVLLIGYRVVLSWRPAGKKSDK
jgi:uncharacterized membrane protein YeaQ/YmgE (transglycosylase-associated protein family)